jgi:hypothetical protein
VIIPGDKMAETLHFPQNDYFELFRKLGQEADQLTAFNNKIMADSSTITVFCTVYIINKIDIWPTYFRNRDNCSGE